MLLAEKGLPTSANAGYELFDNVGSLGLTSFMQQVTRVRALEGEIARTIQSIAGIRAARVHIVMSRARQLPPRRAAAVRLRRHPRRRASTPTASAASIRYLVAAAVPGLDAEKVTVLDSNGTLLAAGDDPDQHQRQPLARRRAHRRDADRGQHPPRAGALSRPGQFPRQRQGRRQHRHAPDRGDHLRSGIARRALDPGRARQREQQPEQSADARPRVEQNLPETEAARHRRPAVHRAERAQGGDDQLRDQLQEASPPSATATRVTKHVDRGGRQPAAAGRRSSARTRRRRRSPSASPRSRRSSPPRPASTRRAAT